jgi:hypothetical protein
MPATPAVRASDADRESVVAALQAAYAQGRVTMPELEERVAAALAARSDAELATVLHDLHPSPSDPVVRPGGQPTSVRDAGIIAGFQRTGRWLVGSDFRGLAVVGSGVIDLRSAGFIDGETTVHATAIVGTITVVVPEDADVRIGGTGIIGGFDHRDEGPGTPGGPRVTVTGLALCGSVVVERRAADAVQPVPGSGRSRRLGGRRRRQLGGRRRPR